ncbi:hypothetical protein FKR81_22540 [Lentzea tibetensis]|uniref:Lipoprotein n=1 Tax=Lentzea tibetensis TaxID=2591470 RepID=A0A563EQT5_9PSEU|nr:hypothetical protein [Lentzea tibetensis]TWP50010.1 hypothetical protein FKR81_22540 [Lentzea tibetensis]
MRLACLLMATTLLTACAEDTPPPALGTAGELATTLTQAARAKGGYSFSLTSRSGPASGTVRLTDRPSLDVTLDRVVRTGGQPERLRFVSTDQTYVLLPPVFDLPQAKPWVKLDRAQTDEFTAGMLAYFDAAAQQALFTEHHLKAVAQGKLTSTVERDGKTTYAVTVEVTTFTITVEGGLPTRIVVSTPSETGPIVDEASFSWGAVADISAPSPDSISPRS